MKDKGRDIGHKDVLCLKSLKWLDFLTVDDIYMSNSINLTIPEPATMLILGLGGLALSFRKRQETAKIDEWMFFVWYLNEI
jgi:hypothetical protein